VKKTTLANLVGVGTNSVVLSRAAFGSGLSSLWGWSSVIPDVSTIVGSGGLVVSGMTHKYAWENLSTALLDDFSESAFSNFDLRHLPSSWVPLLDLIQNASWELVLTAADVSSGSVHRTYAEQTLSWKDTLIQAVKEYRTRVAGWDGYEARPISPAAIDDTREFIALLPDQIEPPHDQPCSDGEVSLVWRKGKRFAEVSFPGDGTFYWYATDEERTGSDEGVPVRRGLPLHLQEIVGLRPPNTGKLPNSIPPILYQTTAYISAAG
jgi:hypothetical protein